MVRRALVVVMLLAATAHAETLTLDAALKTGLRSHPSLMLADANRDAAFARIGEAYASYLPLVTVSGVGTGSYANAPFVGASANGSGSIPPGLSASYSAGVAIKQNLYDFGRTRWQVAAARDSYEGTRADRETARATVELGVAQAYYNVLQAIALKQVAEDSLAQSEQHLAQANALYHTGTRPEIDVASAEASRAQAKLALVHAKNGVSIAKVNLNQAMGIVAPIDYDVVNVTNPVVDGENRVVEAMVDEALKARPEYASLKNAARVADDNVKGAFANYYPTLTGNGSAGANGNYTAPDPTFNFSTNLTLSQQLFAGWSTKRTVEENRANARAADANLEALAQSVRTNVITAALGVQEAVEAVDAATTLRTQADKQLALATGRYNGGVGTIIELVDAQQGAVAARNQKVQAEYTLASSRATLLRALGRPLSPTAAAR